MENIDFITIDQVIQNWKQTAPSELDFNEDLIEDVIMDAIDDIGTYKQYKERIQIKELKNYKVELPCGFKQTLFVLIRPKQESCRPLELIEYTKPEYGNSNCEWVYKKNCKCPEKKDCCCTKDYIETAGWWFIDNMTKLENLKFSSVYDFTKWNNIDTKQWKVLLPKRNELSVINRFDEKFKVVSEEYTIDNGYLYTDYKNAEILIGYLGIPLDSNGVPMVPNNGNYIQALVAAIEKKYAYISYRKSKNNTDFRFFEVAKREYIEYKMRARSDLNEQTFSEMWSDGLAINSFFIDNDHKNVSKRNKGQINNILTRY